MREAITNYIRAGYPGLYLVTAEETRAESELRGCAHATGHGLVAQSATTGLVDTKDGRSLAGEDPMEAVAAVAGLPDNLPEPGVIAQEIADDLEAAQEQFAEIAEDLK